MDGIDPTDIVQGKLANCYFLAALAGLAEDPPHKAHLKIGERIVDNILVTEYNTAGCYAIQMTVDGEPLTVVIDDWFPFYKTKQMKEKFAFSRTVRRFAAAPPSHIRITITIRTCNNNYFTETQ